MVGQHMPRQKSSEMQSRLVLWREQGEGRSRETGALWTGASFPQNAQLLPWSHDSTFQDSVQWSHCLLGRTHHVLCGSLGETHYFVMYLKVLTITICDACNNISLFGDFFAFHIELKRLTKGLVTGLEKNGVPMSLTWRKLLVLSILCVFKGSSLLPGSSDCLHCSFFLNAGQAGEMLIPWNLVISDGPHLRAAAT